MPASYIHKSIVLDVADALKEKAAAYGREAPLLSLGAQGPDVLFYYRILSPASGRTINHTGEQMHRYRTGAMIRAILRYARHAGVKAQAWAMGWVGHCAVDSTLHPYVYDYCSRYDPHRRSIEHMHLEQAMDVWFHRERRHDLPFRQFSFFDELSREDTQGAADLLSRAASDVRPEASLTATVVRKAFSDMNRILRLLYSPDGRRYGFFGRLEGLLGQPGLITCHAAPPLLPREDFLNLAHHPWENPWQPGPRTQSIPDLIHAAHDLTVHLLDSVIDYFSGEKTLDQVMALIGDIDYRSGLPCGPEGV